MAERLNKLKKGANKSPLQSTTVTIITSSSIPDYSAFLIAPSLSIIAPIYQSGCLFVPSVLGPVFLTLLASATCQIDNQ